MTISALDKAAELERLLGADKLARPARPLGEGTAGRRDPSPTWDAWYCLPLTTRRQLLPFMAPAGRGLALDDVADIIGAGSLEEALELWARACQMARRGARTGWDSVDVDAWAAADRQAEADAELYGPAELAELLGISVPNLHQRLSRARRARAAGTADGSELPEPDMVISRVPIWTGETVRMWQEWAQ